ncbi:MAG: pilus assembly PilX N-terminal domain-containing protein [Candidatus Moranbacteria bacterium]|nr:pilus assembly PilX N-terminal domain-containing protein [Candidatus Moranbacteria bacterium]
MNKNKRPKNGSGSALIFATIILFSLLAITVTLSAITVQDMKMSQKTKSSTGAFFNADSGIEWALYKITSSDSSVKINSLPGVIFNTDGSAQCPFGGCNVFFLKDDGTVITQAQAGSLYVSDIKAVRSVGTQGQETQRAIEAAVAATGGASFTYYCNIAAGALPTPSNICTNAGGTQGYCPSGFRQIYDLGSWGFCGYGSPIPATYFRPPGGCCSSGWTVYNSGEAYVCSQ